MTPKDKAQEIFDSFRFGLPCSYLEREVDEIQFSKECSLITIKKILDSHDWLCDYFEEAENYIEIENYWNDVILEINKL